MNVHAHVLDKIGQVIQIDGRAFPGMCFQGDTIFYLYMSLIELYNKIKISHSLLEEDLLTLEIQIEMIEERLIHYFEVCIKLGFDSELLKQKFHEIKQLKDS